MKRPKYSVSRYFSKLTFNICYLIILVFVDTMIFNGLIVLIYLQTFTVILSLFNISFSILDSNKKWF